MPLGVILIGTQTHVENDLFQLGYLHHVGIAELLLQLGNYFLVVLYAEAGSLGKGAGFLNGLFLLGGCLSGGFFLCHSLFLLP